MAANIVAMRAMYVAPGCSNAIANYLIDNEELETCEDLAEMHPEDVRQLSKSVRNPGGGDDGHAVPNKATRRLIHASQDQYYWLLAKRAARVDRELKEMQRDSDAREHTGRRTA